jgi:KaiC/GvpD/RAD55 family RecA-like ATPase
MTMRIVRFAEMEWTEAADYLIKGLLYKKQISVVYGPPNCGKSYWALGEAYNVARNQASNGRRVAGGRVIYVAAEGASGLRNRVAALKQQFSPGPLPLDIIEGDLDLSSRDSAHMSDLLAMIRATGVNPVWIIVDTLASVFRNGSENDAEAMGKFIDGMKHLRDETEAHITIIHHTGKDVDRGARGSSALRGAVDTEILIEEKQVQRIARITKQREAPRAEPFAFSLLPVPLGVDSDGDTVSACVVIYEEVESSAFLGRAARIAMGVLSEFADQERDRYARISRTELLSRCVERGLCNADAQRPSQRKAMLRALEELRELGIADFDSRHAWLLPAANDNDRLEEDRQDIPPF